jgi:hypothetical protein
MGRVLHTKGTSGGGGTGTGWDGQVEFRADLPITLGTPAIGDIYLVEKKTTLMGFTTYQSGLYIRDTNSGALSDWRRLNVKVNFTDSEFTIVSSADNSKKAKFDLSLVTTSTTRTYIYPDKNGTIALLSDVATPDLQTVLDTGNETGDNNIVLDPGSGIHTSPPSRGAISVTDPGSLTTSTIFFLQDSPNTRIDITNGGTVNEGSIVIKGEAQASLRHTTGGFVSATLTGVQVGGGILTVPSSTGFQLQDGANEIVFTASPTSSGLTQTFQDDDGVIALTKNIPKAFFAVNLDSAESSVARVVAGGRTTFTVTHNLNTLDLKPEVFRLSNGRTMGWRTERTGVNTVEVSRTGNVADGDFRILI